MEYQKLPIEGLHQYGFCLRYARFIKLEAIFETDETFQKLLETLRKERSYFLSLPETETVTEVIWWLYHCNISCTSSYLLCEEDFKLFAQYIVFKNTSEIGNFEAKTV